MLVLEEFIKENLWAPTLFNLGKGNLYFDAVRVFK